MSKALELFKPSQGQYDELKSYAEHDPELKEIFHHHNMTIDQVMKAIDKMPNGGLKEFMIQCLPQVAYLHAAEEAKTYLLYKTGEERDNAIDKAKMFKNALIKLTKKHDDRSELNKVNQELSELTLHNIKSVKPLSDWRKKSISAFLQKSKEQIKESKQLETLDDVWLQKIELEELKMNKRIGPRLDNIDSIHIETKQLVGNKNEIKTINTIRQK